MTETYTGENRRQYLRREEKLVLHYREARGMSLDHLSEQRNSDTMNLCGGGICFEAEVYVPVSSVMDVVLKKAVAGGQKTILPIPATGKVVWIRQVETGNYRLGLEFLDIEESHREEIFRNVQEGLAEGKGC